MRPYHRGCPCDPGWAPVSEVKTAATEPAMKRILFVDDESFVLQALQRMLRPMCLEWEMSFADSGAAALEMFQEKPFDVVVADMNMPKMDGSALLREVAKLNPKTVRIGLSGMADPRFIPGGRKITHQFLTKPCAAADLVATVERTCNAEWAVRNEALGNLFARFKATPGLPTIYNEMVRMLDDTDCSIDAVDAAVRRYPRMIARMIDVVNSTYFSTSHVLAESRERVGFSGEESFMSLLAVDAFAEFSKGGVGPIPVDKFNAHAASVAIRAKAIALSEGVDCRTADDSLLAGLLHDCGQLLLAANFPEEFAQAVEIARSESQPMHLAERRVFGIDHAEVGSHLLALWGLPSSVVAAVALHHSPAAFTDLELTPLVIVHFADAIENESGTVFGEGCVSAEESLLEDSPLSGHVETWRHLSTVAA